MTELEQVKRDLEIARLELIAAASIFDAYAQIHEAKRTAHSDLKAMANRRHAKMARLAAKDGNTMSPRLLDDLTHGRALLLARYNSERTDYVTGQLAGFDTALMHLHVNKLADMTLVQEQSRSEAEKYGGPKA